MRKECRKLSKIMSFVKKKASPITTTITSIISIVLAILANALFEWLCGTMEGDSTSPVEIFLFIVFILALVFIIYIAACGGEIIKAKFWPEYMDDLYMKHAFLHIRKLGAERQESFHETLKKELPHPKTENFMISETMQNIYLVVQSCYEFFESAFSTTGQLVNDIEFESTFMTKSYVDNEITIPCSANKEKRIPLSMQYRATDKMIYSQTETAKVYAQPKPSMILIEDTSAEAKYTELYADQKSRIKSTVVLPVLSHENKLLGTLVVHCNKKNFFKQDRYAFWKELLEIFSVEIGYHKLMLDYYISNNPDLAKPF